MGIRRLPNTVQASTKPCISKVLGALHAFAVLPSVGTVNVARRCSAEHQCRGVFVPPLPEQRAIAGLLDRVDESIERVRDEREALQSLKASTADAMLTGQVRVADYQSHAYLTERF